MGLLPIQLTRYQALGPFEEANLGPEEKFGHFCSPLGWELVDHSLDLEALASRSLRFPSLQDHVRFLQLSVALLLNHLHPPSPPMPLHRST